MTPSVAGDPLGCFCLNSSNVASFSGKTPLYILFVNSFIAPLMLPCFAAFI